MIRNLLRKLGLLKSPPTSHLDGAVIASRWPGETDLRDALRAGATHLINLTESRHDAAQFSRLGIVELHLPVKDFHPPAPEQVRAAIDFLARAPGPVLIHCRGGLGRTGTLIACLYVSRGMTVEDAIARTRAERPGTIETKGQLEAIQRHGEA
jgi:protein-tyrosine phosphatase